MEVCYVASRNGKSEYEYYEKRSRSAYQRKCIDGKITGCGNCVGYCKYTEHPGFITRELRREHNCITKGCYYYVPKPKRSKQQKEKISTAVRLIYDI